MFTPESECLSSLNFLERSTVPLKHQEIADLSECNNGESPLSTSSQTRSSLTSPSDRDRSINAILYSRAQLTCHDLTLLIAKIREAQVVRTQTMRAQFRLDNQCRSLARRALGWRMDAPEKDRKRICAEAEALVKALFDSKPVPDEFSKHAMAIRAFVWSACAARKCFDKILKNTEAEMRESAIKLPPWPWVESVNGLGALGLAIIIGEAGDLAGYSTKMKLWKRLGLATFDGKAQRKCTDPVLAEIYGYNPRRRSAIWTIADSLLRAKNKYSDAYHARREYEITNHPELLRKRDDDGTIHLTAHGNKKAKRYAEKMMIRDLWQAWRRSIKTPE